MLNKPSTLEIAPETRNYAETLAFVAEIMLEVYGPDILSSDDKNALKMTCKATRAVVHPYFKTVKLTPRSGTTLGDFISICSLGATSVQGSRIWDPSHVESLRIDMQKADPLLLYMFIVLPLPKLKKLKFDNVNVHHTSVIAEGRWPALSKLKLAYGASTRTPDASSVHTLRHIVRGWPLESLEISFNDLDRHLNAGHILKSILADFPAPRRLKIEHVMAMHDVEIAAALAATPLDRKVENIELCGSAPRMLAALALGNWPSIRSVQLNDLNGEAIEKLDGLPFSSWLHKISSLQLFGSYELHSGVLRTLLPHLTGGRLETLALGFGSGDLNALLPLRNAYLPRLKHLSLSTTKKGGPLVQREWVPGGIIIDKGMDALFSAQFPELEQLEIVRPLQHQDDEILWRAAPAVPATIAFPKLRRFQLSGCCMDIEVVRYLRKLHLEGCEVALDYLEDDCIAKINYLTPEIRDIMEYLELSQRDLDQDLKERGKWLDFWCWGNLMTDTMKAAVLQACMSKVKHQMLAAGDIPARILSKVMLLLERVQEDEPAVMKVAVDNAKWLAVAKGLFDTARELASFSIE